MIAIATRGGKAFMGDDFLADGFAIVDTPEVVTGLHIQPQRGGCAQSLGQPLSHVSGDGGLTVEHSR